MVESLRTGKSSVKEDLCSLSVGLISWCCRRKPDWDKREKTAGRQTLLCG